MSVAEVKTRLLENVSINNSEFDPGYSLGQDFYEDESWVIGAMEQTDTSTIHIYSRDSDGKVQIRTLSDKEMSLDIGNAATEDSGSNIDVEDTQNNTGFHEGPVQQGLQKISASNGARILDGINAMQQLYVAPN